MANWAIATTLHGGVDNDGVAQPPQELGVCPECAALVDLRVKEYHESWHAALLGGLTDRDEQFKTLVERLGRQ